MSVDLLNSSIRGENARNALAEIRACAGELQAFVAGEFDRIEALADEIIARQTSRDQTRHRAERKMMQDQIDQLARVAAEVAELVAEQKRLSGKRDRA